MKDDLFLGTWELVPALSQYEFGPLPSSGTYEITDRDGEIHIRIRWTLGTSDAESQMEFGGPADGTRQLFEANPAAGQVISFVLNRIDARTLDSTAFRGEQKIAYARRIASDGGELLSIVQEGQRPDGGTFRNFQVYRRRPG